MSKDHPPSMPADVAAVFDAFPTAVRRRLLNVRGLMFETAAKVKGVGQLTETLKWGEPAYLTEQTGSGSTIRLGRLAHSDQYCAVLFNCRTTLIESFRDRFPDEFDFQQNRALVLPVKGRLPRTALSFCVAMALTYHLDRRRSRHSASSLL